jgi:hypothetical protein
VFLSNAITKIPTILKKNGCGVLLMTAKSRENTTELNATDSLNRATLRLTFNTIRKSNPVAALLIQNVIMSQTMLSASKADGELFTIDLADEQIEHIIQTLLALCLIASQQQYPSTNMNTLRGLLNQWTRVANHRKLFSENLEA